MLILHCFGGFPFYKETLIWESGDSAEKSGAVPATVSPLRMFLKFICHCPNIFGWEGFRNRTSQETCQNTTLSKLSGIKAK